MRGLTILVASALASSLALLLAMPGETHPLATKSGVKYKDLDGDGYRDAGEPGVSGWKIHLFGTGEGGSKDLTTTTDSQGRYSFTVPKGTYTVCEEQKAGWVQTFPNPGSDGNRCETHGHTGWSGAAPHGYYFTLSAGQTHSGNDFGNKSPARKEGKKFKDLDGDGYKDAGEPGLGGWVIRAYRDNNPANDVLDPAELSAGAVASATTSYSTGAYSLSLAPGDYIVCEVQQSGWMQTYPSGAPAECAAGASLGPQGYAVTLSAGQVDDHNDFGNAQKALKEGKKFKDMNGNGYKDWWEPALSGWVIRAYADNNPQNGDLDLAEFTAGPVASATTNWFGLYSMSLVPGSYIVCEVQQTGWAQTAPSGGPAECDAGSGLAPQGYAVTLKSGECDTGNNFGNVPRAVKSGVKFNDLDADGVKDAGEPGLSGWTIRAYTNTNGDNDLDAGEPLVASTVTDGSGAYSFSLAPGNYVVCEVLQPGWTQTHPSGGVAECASDAALGPQGYAFTMTSHHSHPNNNFGNSQQGSKSGLKYEDDNGDGNRDGGEDPLAGWEIRAYVDTNGNGSLEAGETTLADSDTTAAGTGAYALQLSPGKYVVCEVLQAGLTQSEPAPADNECGDTIAGLGDGGYAITVTSGSSDPGNEFGNFRRATKRGMKFNDLDADGVKEAGEPGLDGWRIHLFGTDGLGNAVHEHATTAGGGNYSFSLAPGSYTVCEELQSGWTQSFPNPGTDGSACEGHSPDSGGTMGPYGYGITLVSGQVDYDNDFGNSQAEVCEKGPVKEVLDPATGRFPGNEGPDVIVETNPPASGSIQNAVDNVTDVNNDGYLIVFVRKDGTGDLGGNTAQDVVIDDAYAKTFALIGCSVELRDPDDTDPAIWIKSTAASPGNIFLMDLHAAQSSLGPGIKVDGDGRYLRNEEANNNAVGLHFASNGNTMHNGSATGNTGVGILAVGNLNKIDDADASSNGGHGVQVTGDQNEIKVDAIDNRGDGVNVTGDSNVLDENTTDDNDVNGTSVAGDSNKIDGGSAEDNGGVGFLVVGDSNVIDEAESFGNGSHGFQVSGDSNQLLSLAAGDRGKANGADGVNLAGKGNLVDGVDSFANLGDGFEVSGGTAASPNVLKENTSGDSGKANSGNGFNIHDDVGNGTPNPIELEANTAEFNSLNGFLIADRRHRARAEEQRGRGQRPLRVPRRHGQLQCHRQRGQRRHDRRSGRVCIPDRLSGGLPLALFPKRASHLC